MRQPDTMVPLKILVLSFSQIASDPRVLRQVAYFTKRHDVTTAGFGQHSIDRVQHIELSRARDINRLREMFTMALRYLRLHRFTLRLMATQRNARERLSGTEWDVVIANDVLGAPVANSVKSKFGVLVDLHEYAPRQGEDNQKWRLLNAPLMRWVLRHEIAGRAAAVTTVAQGIADEYRRVFGIDARLVINATPKYELEPKSPNLPLKLVHSGAASPARRLEVMIDAMKISTAEATLDLYLVPSFPAYLAELKERAGDDSRIRFHDPVPYDNLLATLNLYDVGLTIIAPTTFNLKWCLPNKFFDYVQARLGVITGPSPEMVRYVEKYEFGAVSEDFSASAVARVLDRLTVDSVHAWKARADSVTDELSGERQAEVWGDLVAGMVGPRR